MNWADRGLCRTQAEQMFAEGAAQNEAKAVCVHCPVQVECLAYALDHRVQHGVWGAMTERERRALLRRRPDVTSWAEILQTARARYEAASLSGSQQARRAMAVPVPRVGRALPVRGDDVEVARWGRG
ncbi:WhiB family transcriptional regulator [Streptomyces sp. NPDC001020]